MKTLVKVRKLNSCKFNTCEIMFIYATQSNTELLMKNVNVIKCSITTIYVIQSIIYQIFL